MRWRAAVIAGAGILAYANSLWGPFIFDDMLSVVENQQIRDWRRLGSVLFPERELPTAGRPLVNFSFALNYAFGGLDPRGYHLVNLALHLMAGLAVFGVVRRTLDRLAVGNRPAANIGFAAALIWTLHPLNTEAVNYVTQRTELMMGLFYLLTLYACVRRWNVAAVVSSAAGMACKESMATAPVVVVLYESIFTFGSVKRALAERWRFYAALAGCWMVLGALMWSGPRVHSAGFSSGVSPWTYLLNQTVMIAEYLRRAVWPRSLVLNYGWPIPLTIADVLPYALLVTLLLALTIVALVRWPRVGFLGAWFFITLAPTSSIVPIATEVGAERRMYLPLIALVVLAVWGASLLRRAGPAVAAAALVTLSTALAAGTFARNREYASALTLARTIVDRHPTPFAEHVLASELLMAGHRDDAMVHLRRALPGAPRAHYTLGAELLKEGKLEDAIDELQAFVREQPMLLEAVSARRFLGAAYLKLQRWPEAIEQARLVLTMKPAPTERVEAERLLADALFGQESLDEALTHYRLYLQARPNDVGALAQVGIIYAATNRLADAVSTFRRAVDLDPKNGNSQRNLATALLDSGDLAGAVDHARQAAALRPGDRDAVRLIEQALALQQGGGRSEVR